MARTKALANRNKNIKFSTKAATSASPSTPKRRSTRGLSSGTGSAQNQGTGTGTSSSLGNDKKAKRRYRARPGTRALREIRKFQKTTHLLIPAAPFIRLVKELSNFYAPNISRWQAEALVALQEAAEDYLVSLFGHAMLCAIHAKRVTLMKKDWELARRLGGKGQPF